MSGFITPQSSEDCCCNGSVPPEPCRCYMSSGGCGIRVTCLFPRDAWNLPSKEPYQIRIVKLNPDGTVHSVVAGPTNDFDLIWNPAPGTSGTYRAEVCCENPGYDDCVWTPIGTVVLNITSDSCPLHVGILVCVSSLGTCGSSNPEAIRIFGYARSNCKLTSLKINGSEILTGSDVYQVTSASGSGCIQTIAFNNCGPDPVSGGWSHPTGIDNVKTNLYISDDSPVTDVTSYCATATDDCGNFRECCVDVPCWLTKNFLRMEFPAISPLTWTSMWLRTATPSLASVMADSACADATQAYIDARAAECGGTAPSWASYFYRESIELSQELDLTFAGGTYFWGRTPGNSTVIPCNAVAQLVATGTFTFDYEELGRKLMPDGGFPNLLQDVGAAYCRFGATYAVSLYIQPPTSVPNRSDFRLEIEFATDGTGYFETNSAPALKPNPPASACDWYDNYSGVIAGGPLRKSSSNSLFPAIIRTVLAEGCTQPTCGEGLKACVWELLKSKAATGINWLYGAGGASNICGYIETFSLDSQSGSYVVPMPQVYFWQGSTTMPTTNDDLSLGTLYTEWVAV